MDIRDQYLEELLRRTDVVTTSESTSLNPNEYTAYWGNPVYFSDCAQTAKTYRHDTVDEYENRPIVTYEDGILYAGNVPIFQIPLERSTEINKYFDEIAKKGDKPD